MPPPSFLRVSKHSKDVLVSVSFFTVTLKEKPARYLGCWFDSRLSMESHITKICASSFYYIYNILRIRKCISRQSTEILIHSFITSRLDYCNGLLYGLPDCLLNKLQRVQNACARLIFREQKFCHVTPLIYEFLWLPIKYRIEFKILLIIFKILNFLAPFYLSSLISLRACLHGVRDPGLVGLVSIVFTLWGTQNKRNLPH